MLNKEIFLARGGGATGWRELTVEKITGPVTEGYGWYYSRGQISDNTVDGDPFDSLYSWHDPSQASGWRYGTEIKVDRYYWPSLYVKREGGNVVQLTKYQQEGYSYMVRSNSSSAQVIFEEDLNKTINIYVGSTPPP